MSRRRRAVPADARARAFHALLAFALVSASLAACNGCHGAPAPTVAAPRAAEPPPTVRLYFLSDLAGALEPCGCVKDQLGGLDHAAAWIDGQRAVAPASLFVTAGSTFFMDPILEKDHRAQDVAKAEAIASSLAHLGLSAWAPAGNDWAAGAAEVTKLAQLAAAPALEANLDGDAGAKLLPTRIVAVNAAKIALIGVGGGPPTGGATATSAEEAVKQASMAARAAGANMVVVLASVGRGEAKRIADAVPDLTAIVVGDPSDRGDSNTAAPPGEQVGNVLIAETANHLQTVGVADFFVRGDSYVFADGGGLGDAAKRQELTRRIDDLHFRLANWEKDRSIAEDDLAARKADLLRYEAELADLGTKPPPATGSYFRYAQQEVRDALGGDASIKATLASYYRLVNEANRVELEGRFPPPVEPGHAGYLGVEACSACHASEKKFWDKTAHAGAYATLSTQSKEFNLDCVSCHVTGYGRPGGSTVTHVDKLQDVQCEVCHGPGSLHAAAPREVKLPSPEPASCITCHKPPHVDSFDAVAKMKLVVGPGHGR